MPPTLGRDRELARLEELLDAVVDRGSTIEIVGDPGIGKSTLLDETAARAISRGLSVLRTAGVEFETAMPFAGLHQLLRHRLGAAETLPANQRDALSRALGETEGPAPTTFLVALAVLSLLAELAAVRPVVVLADDLQWLDPGTEEVLAFVGRRIAHDPVSIVVATRPGHEGPVDRAGFAQVELGPLAEDSARELLRAQPALSTDRYAQVLALAQGNPLALVELPLALTGSAIPEPTSAEPGVAPLTARLERAFAARIADISDTGRALLLTAAIDGRGEVGQLLAATGALTGTAVGSETVDEAVAVGLLRREGDRLVFSHPLVGAAARQREPAVRHQAAHAALAEVPGSDPLRRAWHRAGAVVGPDDRVAAELEALHATPALLGSPVTVALLERSAQLSSEPGDRARRTLLAAEQAFNLGRVDRVGMLLGRAAPDVGDDLTMARVTWLRELLQTGSPADELRVPELCRCAEQAIAGSDTVLGLNLVLTAGIRCWFDDPGAAVRAEVVRLALTMGRQVPALRDHPIYATSLAFADPLGHGVEVAALVDRLADGYSTNAQAMRILGYGGIATGHLVLGQHLLARSAALFRAEGQLGMLIQGLVGQVPGLVELGDWALAEENGAEAGRLARDSGQPHWESGSRIERAMVRALRGDNDTAQELAGWAPLAMAGNRKVRSLAQLVSGLGWLATGQHQDAFAVLARMFDRADPTFHLTDRFKAVAYLAESAVHCDRRSEASAILADLDREVGETASTVLGHQRRYAAAVLAAPGEEEDRYREALDADLAAWPWYRARIELAFGQWLRRRRRVSESRTLLRSAYTTLSAIGAPAWAAQARTELRAAGDRATPGPVTPPSELSPQEAQIARLAAEGLSNREIGARLFLSHRTVGSHLYRIFPKLGVTSRAQLAAHITRLSDEAVV